MAGDGASARRRRRPVQARSQATVDFLLEAAARVFKREGFAATTNRIATAAGVSIGTLYEYFPHKQALLFALAERHVELAEAEIRTACNQGGPLRDLLAAIQSAVVASQRFPSQALDLIERGAGSEALKARVAALRKVVLQALAERAAHLSDPALCARAAFGAIGELTARTLYEFDDDPTVRARLSAYLLDMAVAALQNAAGASPSAAAAE
jgi:AcrR family transcriptional regulator